MSICGHLANVLHKHEATRSGAGMRMEEAQVKLRSSDCAVFFHMWFATKCHEEKYLKKEI